MTENKNCVRVSYIDGNATDLHCDSEKDARRLILDIMTQWGDGVPIMVHDNLYINPRNVIYIEMMEERAWN